MGEFHSKFGNYKGGFHEILSISTLKFIHGVIYPCFKWW